MATSSKCSVMLTICKLLALSMIGYLAGNRANALHVEYSTSRNHHNVAPTVSFDTPGSYLTFGSKSSLKKTLPSIPKVSHDVPISVLPKSAQVDVKKLIDYYNGLGNGGQRALTAKCHEWEPLTNCSKKQYLQCVSPNDPSIIKLCFNDACGTWSPWTVCNNNVQYRFRPECAGENIEYRECTTKNWIYVKEEEKRREEEDRKRREEEERERQEAERKRREEEEAEQRRLAEEEKRKEEEERKRREEEERERQEAERKRREEEEAEQRRLAEEEKRREEEERKRREEEERERQEAERKRLEEEAEHNKANDVVEAVESASTVLPSDEESFDSETPDDDHEETYKNKEEQSSQSSAKSLAKQASVGLAAVVSAVVGSYVYCKGPSAASSLVNGVEDQGFDDESYVTHKDDDMEAKIQLEENFWAEGDYN
ncbi:Reticulocyte-binding protein 2 -like protein a [Babesia sp. Xinjiang]|uniref:Reticulocyte-binding protein 2 -like protein a n=1 Tax=Babesia sp. Xinjiang TaxID=462227 RepID=UPI000A215788|nr:Reticulocyte-binding protein 2 -like protein a [Babesia sp. Xinjiang]ORM40496.1 Reticulocyte-binding protein 2 -like protein a [Babesia sp. Xinjiang]